jgi:hypothetical protein
MALFAKATRAPLSTTQRARVGIAVAALDLAKFSGFICERVLLCN